MSSENSSNRSKSTPQMKSPEKPDVDLDKAKQVQHNPLVRNMAHSSSVKDVIEPEFEEPKIKREYSKKASGIESNPSMTSPANKPRSILKSKRNSKNTSNSSLQRASKDLKFAQ